jgi:stearoyl-CoA desaturase (delta-9 desaturase)
VRQGFRWWEIDATYYILRGLSFIGVVWDLKTPPAEVLRNEQRLGSRVVNRAAQELAAHFNSERIALAVSSALHGPRLHALQDTLTRAHNRTTEVLGTLHLPQIPNRDEVLAQAKAMFARTPSLDEIVDRAYELMLVSVGSRLLAPAA